MTTTVLARQHRPGRRRIVALATLGAVLACLVLVHQFWWSKPTAFSGWGGGEMSTRVKINQTLNVDMVDTGHEDISFHGARPAVVTNSADADVEFVICHHKADVHVGGSLGSLDRFCASTYPLSGYDLRQDHSADESIIMRITPRQAGTVRFDGIIVNYTRGWRHIWQTGSEHMGIGVSITAK